MITYEHDAYIMQAIEGVLMQNTSFDLELIIGEDHSSDKTRTICEKYAKQNPETIKLLTDFGENMGVQKNLLRTFQACTGKYIAICEGDDYWTDPYKLQKQVDFLETHPDYGLVHGDTNHLDQKSGKLTLAFNRTNNIKIPSGNIFEFLIKPSHSIKTMTTCFRRELFEKHYLSDNEIMSKDWRFIDISVWLTLSYHTKIKYFEEVFATYRLLPESMSRTKDYVKLHQFNLLIYDIRNFYLDKYNCTKQIRDELTIYFYKRLLHDSIFLRDKNMSIKSITQLHRMKKFGIKDLISFVYHFFFKYGKYS